MSNSMRWRYGDTNPVMLAAEGTSNIEIGDLLYSVNGSAAPASNLSDTGTEEGNQEAFHDAFVGVAMQASPAGETNLIRIATSGVFEFECAASTFDVGDLLGLVEDGTGTELEDQLVKAVATPNLAIGRCARTVNPAGTRVLVDIVSTVLRGGPQAAA